MVLILLESAFVKTKATNILAAAITRTITLLNIPPAKRISDAKLPKIHETITPTIIVTEADFLQYPNHKDITANAAAIIE